MAACLAAPWPSQQRAGRNKSERHAALARMRERHARGEDEEPPSQPRPPVQPRPPAQPRGSETRPARSLGGSGRIDMGSSKTEPWAPAWDPESPTRRREKQDDDSPPPAPRRPTPPEPSSRKGRGPWSETAPEEELGRGTRVRGPNEVRTARDVAEEDDALPPGAQAADFKTLQMMIARGIQDAEKGATKMEADVPKINATDDEERRFRERQRQRREQEAAQREKERERARQKRKREEEERQRRQAEELAREEREAVQVNEERAAADRQCRKELAAAMRIQARVRGRRCRAGLATLASPGVRAVLHTEPWSRSCTFPVDLA